MTDTPTQLEALDLYVVEAARCWERDPDWVRSRVFFAAWQHAHKPAPFRLSAAGVSIGGCAYDLPQDTDRVARVVWRRDEGCAALVVEGTQLRHTLLLPIEDGQVAVHECDPEVLEDEEVSYGERLEVMFDVVACLREERPDEDVRQMTLATFRQVLRQLADSHEPRVLRVLRRRRAPMVRSLLARALEDMAADEITNQLALPLDGTYAATTATRPVADDRRRLPRPAGHYLIPDRAAWDIERDLLLLVGSGRLQQERERTFFIFFKDAVPMRTDEAAAAYAPQRGDETALQVPIDPDAPLREGNTLPVYRRGVDGALALFTVDLLDGAVVYGRMRWGESQFDVESMSHLYARPPRGTTEFVRMGLDAVLQHLRQSPDVLSPALRAVLGVEDAPFELPGDGEVNHPDSLDASQGEAWATAVCERNPVVLVQGPPGTGKTALLEQVLRTLCRQGRRVLVTAPSNTAVDNICRRCADLPVLRFAKRRETMSADIAARFWVEDTSNVRRFVECREARGGGGIYAGTHLGLLRADIVAADLRKNGLFDAVLFDEAGMSRMDEVLLCLELGRRAILFGDHQQLPPYPLPKTILATLEESVGVLCPRDWRTLSRSGLEWLADDRGFPVRMLQRSYRCQNPRLMRFASTLFYDARVRASEQAEYYRLPYAERQRLFPSSALRLYRTSDLPLSLRAERLTLDGNRPGMQNELEARLCLQILHDALRRYPPDEVTIIAPYRRQVRLLRRQITAERFGEMLGDDTVTDEQASAFARARIATVDSFQGGESDLVIVTYVRSNNGRGIGFVGDHNRINVAHTRCRRELHVVGDIECLKAQADSRIFLRMERAIQRDGEVVALTREDVAALPELR